MHVGHTGIRDPLRRPRHSPRSKAASPTPPSVHAPDRRRDPQLEWRRPAAEQAWAAGRSGIPGSRRSAVLPVLLPISRLPQVESWLRGDDSNGLGSGGRTSPVASADDLISDDTLFPAHMRSQLHQASHIQMELSNAVAVVRPGLPSLEEKLAGGFAKLNWKQKNRRERELTDQVRWQMITSVHGLQGVPKPVDSESDRIEGATLAQPASETKLVKISPLEPRSRLQRTYRDASTARSGLHGARLHLPLDQPLYTRQVVDKLHTVGHARRRQVLGLGLAK